MKYFSGTVLKSYCHTLLKTLLVGSSIVVLVSCSYGASVLDLDADLELNVMAKADMNPDDSETASPLVIRLYELKDKKKFEEIEFYDLYANDKKILGKNLIDKHRLKHFVPDSTRLKKLVLNKSTKYVGLFAEFSQYKDSVFRAVVEIDPHFDRKIEVELSGTTLKVDYKKNNLYFELEADEGADEGIKEIKSLSEKLPGA